VVTIGVDAGYTSSEFLASGSTINLPQPRGLLLIRNGSTWTRITHAEPKEFFGAYFLDENNGWLFASDNRIYKTTDGGRTLEFVPDYFRQLAAQTPSPGPLLTPAP